MRRCQCTLLDYFARTLRRDRQKKNNFLTEIIYDFILINLSANFLFIYFLAGEMEQSVENWEHIYVHTAIII